MADDNSGSSASDDATKTAAADAGNQNNSSDEQGKVDAAEFKALKERFDDAKKSRDKFKTKNHELETKLNELSERMEEIEREKEDKTGDVNQKLARVEKERDKLAKDVQLAQGAVDRHVKRAEIARLAIANGCLEDAVDDLHELIAKNVKVKLNEDGETSFDVGSDYDDLEDLVKSQLEKRSYLRKNPRAGGTGDTGGADKNSKSSGDNGLPKGFENWTSDARREWAKENKDKRQAALSKTRI